MDQVSEDENVQDFYDDDTNSVLDADKAAEDKFSSESTDIITVYVSYIFFHNTPGYSLHNIFDTCQLVVI